MDIYDLCDATLLKSSLAYHGPQLLEELKAEQQVNIQHRQLLTSPTHPKNPRDEFNQRLIKFIAAKADLLFARDVTCSSQWQTEVLNENHYAVVPPLEHFMEVPKTQRRLHFYNGIERGDVVTGTVTTVQETGLLLNILTVEVGRIRDLDQLKITAFCALREIPRSHSHENVLETFSIQDKVRAVVLNAQDDRLIVSLQPRNLLPSLDIKLGLVTDEELPLHYRRLVESLSSGGKTYDSYMRHVLEFHNPLNVSNLTSMFGIREDGQPPSLMRGLFRIKYNEEDYGDRLRKGQSYRLAMRSVGEGVKHFKHGNRLEAMQLFNRALQIDAENIEALVARGALYANCESYRRAIEDFEEALRLNLSHANAKKYLHQTLTAFAYNLMDQESESAAAYVRRAVELDPDNKETASLLKLILKKLEPDRKVSPSGSDSGQDLDENQSLINHAKETLLRMIEEDQSGRESRQKSRTLTADTETWSKKDKRLSGESMDLSPGEQRGRHLQLGNKSRVYSFECTPPSGQPGKYSGNRNNLSPELKASGKAKMVTDQPRKRMHTTSESSAVYGPMLPPRGRKESSNRQRNKSYRTSSSSSSSSRSKSSSSFISSSGSSSSSSPSSRSNKVNKRSKRSKDNHKSSENKKENQSQSRDRRSTMKVESVKPKSGSRFRERSPYDLKKSPRGRKNSIERDKNRNLRNSYDRHSESKKRKASPISERSRKRMKMAEDSDRGHNQKEENNKAKTKNTNNVQRNSSMTESSSKPSIINYPSSSSSPDRGVDKKNAKAPTKPEIKQAGKGTKSEKSPPGESLQDLEHFLQELKAKKKAMGK